MTFEEVLDQAMAMLQRRGRLTYRTLQLHFQLDDAHLETLKDELIYGQRLAVDEDGRVLVWTGDADVPQPAPAPPAATAPLSATAPAPSPPEAERRQLTVLFCDLVDATRLSGHLDPEDYRQVVRAYQTTAAAVIQRFDGHIAQYLGDGLLVYFGYPQAHEDDAQRAVHTGLALVEAIEALHPHLERHTGGRLAVRVGIHTGLVVVGEVGGGQRQEQLALGETPNLAARIQSLAAPNTVVISAATQQLVEGYFTCIDLGTHTLKGVTLPQQVCRVVQASGAQTRLEVAARRGLSPLVGRESEVALLQERWAQVKEGLGQVVLLHGEAGIGKSRLVQVLKEHVVGDAHTRIECRSSPYYQHTAWYPITDLCERAWQLARDDTPEVKLGKVEQALRPYRFTLAEAVPLFATLLALPLPADRYAPLTLSPQRQRQKTLETILAMVLEQAEHQPSLFILEDVHWLDPTTLELLGLLVEQVPTVRLLLLLTCQPTFQSSWEPRSYVTHTTVSRLTRSQVEQLAVQVAGGKPLPTGILQQLADKADGVPLFVEEMTKAVLESGLLKATNDHYELTGPIPALAIPATLHDSLMARLDRLGAAKGVAQLGATIGRQFAYEVLQAVSSLEAAALQRELGRLVEAELLYQRGVPPQAMYTFKHALIQEAAYQSLLRSTRQQYHQQIAQVIEARFPALVETQPELVAQHYTAAGCAEPAVHYWQRAGEQASDRSAHVEAISHLTTGIELLKTLPETSEHTQQALTLHIALGAVLLMTKGHAAPEVEHTYTQAYTLCQQVGESPQLVPVLFGLWRYYIAQPQFHMTREIGERLLRLAQRVDDPALSVIAHYALGGTWLWRGVLLAARPHLEEAITRYTPEQRRDLVFRTGQDPGVVCRFYAAMTLWLLGYPAQALARLHDALALAHELSHPFSLAWVQSMACFVSQFRRDMPAVYEHAEATIALSTERGFSGWAAIGTFFRGWVLVMQDQSEEGMVQVHQGMAAWRATGAALGVPYFCTLLADVCAHLGHPEDGLQALTEAHALVEQHEERLWEAEIHRLRGVLLLRQPETPAAEAETWLQRALDVARFQEAKSLELRAAMSLSRLWQQQGKRAEAYALLAPVYGWFTEGFDTADLQEARTLLEHLSP
jgi:class 3 adenylate cyclase/predicted ATPase